MKKFAIISMLVLMLALTAFSATALESDATLTLGDDDERASNPEADEEEDQDFFLDGEVTITNNDGQTITDLDYSVSRNGFSESDLQLNVTFDATELDDGEATTARIRVRVPESLDAVSSDLEADAFKAADIRFFATGAEDTTTELKLQRENQLELKDLDVCVNSDTNCQSADSDGDDIDGLKPGDEITLIFTVENKYSDREQEDLDIDGDLEWEIDEDDVDENDDFDFDLRAEDEEEERFTFEIPDDADDDRYELEIKLEGRDEHGARHGEALTIDLEVEKNSHDIDIRSYSASPTTLSCEDPRTTVRAAVTNIGKRDENDVAVEVVNNELGVQERRDGIDLDEGDSTDVSLPISFEDVNEGRYRLAIKAFFGGTAQTDEESVEIIVPSCEEEEPEEVEPTQSEREKQLEEQLRQLAAQRAAQQQQQRVSEQPSSTTEESSSGLGDAWIIAIMGVAALFLLIVLVVLMVKIFKR